jgi:hypothetical protein
VPAAHNVHIMAPSNEYFPAGQVEEQVDELPIVEE